jgi:hypothetical protein
MEDRHHHRLQLGVEINQETLMSGFGVVWGRWPVPSVEGAFP